MPETIVVLGATGNIGRHLVPRLCELLSASPPEGSGAEQRQHIVRLVTRDSSKAAAQFADLANNDTVELQTVTASVEAPETWPALFEGATRVLLLTLTALGPRQRPTEERFVSALLAAAPGTLRHIVRISAHTRVPSGQPSNSPFRWHSECDDCLLALTLDTPVAVTLLRPSLFMQDMERPGSFAGSILAEDTFYQLGKPSTDGSGVFVDGYRIAMVDARDIADVAAHALSEPVERHANNTYLLTGPKALSWGDVAAAISAAVGRDVSATMVSDREFVERFGGSHVYLKQMQAYRSGFQEDVEGDIEVVTGRRARGIEQHCVDYRDAWLK